jgi:diaminohydroxyphosphoribosylaminopyrimidine deaminase/5-amino-6-(5-phosphoribosylamino)uracil reductase
VTLEGVLRDEAEELNEAYFHFMRTGRSLVRLKLAASLDGRVAAEDGSSRWITGVAARKKAHELRAESSAVLVGAGTALADDPALTVRHGADSAEDFVAPARIVVLGKRRLPAGMRLFSGEVRTIIVRPEKAGAPVDGGEVPSWVEQWSLPDDGEGRVDLEALLERTAQEGLGEVLCEGGSGLAAALLRGGLVSRIAVCLAPVLLGANGVPAIGALGIPSIDEAIRILDASVTALEDGNVLVEGRICSPES